MTLQQLINIARTPNFHIAGHPEEGLYEFSQEHLKELLINVMNNKIDIKTLKI